MIWRSPAGRIIYQAMLDRATDGIRRRRGGISLALVLAFLLPLLLAVLPVPAIGEAALLERDLAASSCAQPAEGGQAPDHDGHAPCCILCPSGPSIAATLKASPQVMAPRARIAVRAGAPAERAIPVHRIDLTQIVPRGPPAV